MKITKEIVKEVLDTLPISYYCKRKLDVTLSDTEETSYYKPMNDTMVISSKLILSVLEKLDVDESKIEEITRTMLYHEVSHAIMTPKSMRSTDIRNIFEDERIETILKNFYRNTNFKEFVKLVNNYHGENPKSAIESFYQIVRYRVGKAEFVDEVARIIKDYSHITRSSTEYFDYLRAIEHLFEKIKEDFENDSHKSEVKSEIENEASKKMEGFAEEVKSESSEDNSEEVKSESSTDNSEENSEIENEENEFSEDEIESIISEALDSLKDKELLNGVNSILSRISNNKKRNGSAMNAYSGRFDVRSTLRDDYKFFVQANRTGHIKQFSKTHLNLFIDVSGSFRKHQTTTNSLLYALKEFEKQNTNFEFDVVVMQVGERLLDRDHREIKCDGGNWLDNGIKDIFKKLQFGGYDNYNIVLFDGDALSDYWLDYNKADAINNFKAFDVSNCTFISDFDNHRYVTRAKCKSMKTIFTADYVNEFKKNIFKALQNMTM